MRMVRCTHDRSRPFAYCYCDIRYPLRACPDACRELVCRHMEAHRCGQTPPGDRAKGTPEEYKDASLSASCSFGTYSVDPASSKVTMKIDRSTFPNYDDATQVRAYELKGDILSWKVPARPDGSIPITVLRRIAVQ
jgi:hypothetical protein